MEDSFTKSTTGNSLKIKYKKRDRKSIMAPRLLGEKKIIWHDSAILHFQKIVFPYSEQVIIQKHEDKIPPPG